MQNSFSFKILHKDKKTKARVGKLSTSHEVVETPAFVSVGTQATVKSLTPKDLQEVGTQILFGNTYHLHLRPGEEIIQEFGGLGKFMHFPGITMTDSGGFQVFSLANHRHSGKRGTSASRILYSSDSGEASLVKITEDGVEFKSHLDGSSHFFSPEQSIAIQKKLGADIMLCFDDCAPYPITHEGAQAAMERTHRWAKRSLNAHKELKTENKEQALYGIVQGSIYEDLRKESAKYIGSLQFDGFAIGGVSVGESKKEMADSVIWATGILPEEKVKHLLGIGDVDDIFMLVEQGIDTFDCVSPTRLGRVGTVFVGKPEGNLENRFRIDITKGVYTKSQDPVTFNCECYTCKNFTRGYINHLFRAKELLGYHLATYHNVYFINNLVKQIRRAIQEDKFEDLKEKWLG